MGSPAVLGFILSVQRAATSGVFEEADAGDFGRGEGEDQGAGFCPGASFF